MSKNFYAAGTLDRASHRRRDQDWLAAALAHPETRIVPVWRGQSLFAGGETLAPRLLRLDEAAALFKATEGSGPAPDLPERLVFLGVLGADPDGPRIYALDLGLAETPPDIAGLSPDGLHFADLRAAGPVLSRDEGAILAAARGLVHWHSRHRFCAVCGYPTVSAEAGHVRRCMDPACATTHFPRTDPAVIMLVTQGGRALLGRQAAWALGMYSTLAGFVEIGESLEDAVAREVFEETGVRVGHVTYHSSQPWPFPASLMLGFTAEATSTEVRVDPTELQDAQWFDRAYLRERARDPAPPAEGAFRLPRADSIARRMIMDWIAE